MTNVRAWLGDLNLGRYADAFEENDIDPRALIELTDQDLKDIGVTSLGHRRVLLGAIKQLASQKAEPPAPEQVGLNADAANRDQREAERRQLTVMFCDLVGSTALSGKLDPEDLREVMRAYQDTCAKAIDRYDGHIAQTLGDGLMVYFGYPVAHEDDAQRAVRAGLDIVRAISELSAHLESQQGVLIDVRIGIHTGLVVAGEVGGADTRGDMAVVGETPNIAARIESLAEPGSVVVGNRTRRLIGDVFEFTALGPHELKGLSAPMELFQARAERAADSRFEAMHPEGLTPFVGRDEEINLLLGRWRAAKAGEGQVVTLEGEPGIGKSRITDTFRDMIGGEEHARLQYQCSPFHANSAFYPIIGQLERAAEFAQDDAVEAKLDKLEAQWGTEEPETLALIAGLLSLPVDRYPPLEMTPQRQKERTIEVLVAKLTRLAGDVPVLVVFEDLHWVDATSLEALDQVIGAVDTLPVLVVATFRPEFEARWSGQSHATLLSLNRLGKRQAGELVDQVTGAKRLPDVLRDQIVAKTDGVPLFVEELTKAVIESDIVVDGGDRYELSGSVDAITIPDTLHDSLMARLDKLIPVKEVAQVGAAIGREFSYQLMAALTPMSTSELDAALEKLVESQLVHSRGAPPDATYTFKHALVQDAAYNSMLKRDRLTLHKEIAETLTANFPTISETEPEILAHHYTRAELADAAIPKWLAAGRLALSRFAPTEALGHLRSGFNLIDRLPVSQDRDSVELALLMTTAAAYNATEGWASDYTKTTYDRALPIIQRLGSDESTFDTMIGIYYFYNVRGQMDEGAPVIVDAVTYADKKGSAANKLVAYQAYGQNTWYRGEFAKSVDCFETSMSVYDRAEHAAVANVWGVDFYASDHAWLGSAYWLVGRPDQASSAVLRALEHAKTMQQANTEAWVESICSFARLLQGELDLAVETAISACQKSAAIDYKIMEYIARAVQGAAYILQGANSLGINELERGLASFQGLGGGSYVPWWNSILAFGYAKDGRFDDAQRLLDAAERQAEEEGEVWSDPIIREMRGKAFLLEGENAKAAGQFRDGLEIANTLNSPSMALRVATPLAKIVEPDEGRAVLEPIYQSFTEGFSAPDLVAAKQALDELN